MGERDGESWTHDVGRIGAEVVLALHDLGEDLWRRKEDVSAAHLRRKSERDERTLLRSLRCACDAVTKLVTRTRLTLVGSVDAHTPRCVMMLTSPFLLRRGLRHSGHSLMLMTANEREGQHGPFPLGVGDDPTKRERGTHLAQCCSRSCRRRKRARSSWCATAPWPWRAASAP